MDLLTAAHAAKAAGQTHIYVRRWNDIEHAQPTSIDLWAARIVSEPNGMHIWNDSFEVTDEGISLPGGMTWPFCKPGDPVIDSSGARFPTIVGKSYRQRAHLAQKG